MGKFERAFRKKYRQEVPSYETWRAENRHRFPQPAQSPEQIENGRVMAKRRFPAWGWGVLAGAAVLLALILTLVFLLRDRPSSLPEQPGSIPDLTFGDMQVYSISMSEDDLIRCQDFIMSFADWSVTESTKMLRNDDDSLVLYIVRGELETEADYYFIEARLVFNENYVLSNKDQYENLDESIEINGLQIFYEMQETNQTPRYRYYVLSEYEDVTIYWTVSSINDHFDEWLQLTFAA